MKKIINFIVDQRKMILIIILLITVLSAILIPQVKVNYDLSKYLPKESNTALGIKIMNDNFTESTSFNVMVENIDQNKSLEIYQLLIEIEHVDNVTFDQTSEDYYKDNKALFIIIMNKNEYSEEVKNVIVAIEEKLENETIYLSGSAVETKIMNETMKIEMPIILIVAVALVFIILLIISTSYLEPFIFLFTSAIAIIINYGTNIIFNEVSFITFSIAAILQLALSMDYAIMLLHRYHDEQQENKDKVIAMKKALRASFAAVTSSSLTTIFGLLAMVFMSFTIGADIGLVISKGILINVVVVLTMLPAVILSCDKLLEKTKKKAPVFKVNWLATLASKGKAFITLGIIIIICGGFILQQKLELQYGSIAKTEDTKKIEETFKFTNEIVVLYKNETEKTAVLNFINIINEDDKIISITDYYTSLGKELTAQEMAIMANINQKTITGLYQLYSTLYGLTDKIAIIDFVTFVQNDIITDKNYSGLIDQTTLISFQEQMNILNNVKASLVSEKYHRMILTTTYELESNETFTFIEKLINTSKEELGESSYILGSSAVNYDTKESFTSENMLITIITIVSMLIILAISFKSISIPILLVVLIQGAIWISMSIPVIFDDPLYFLAYIIIQCIQMGATIDYAILLTSNYVEHRNKKRKKEALKEALKRSITTILTSSSILIIATLVISKLSTTAMIQKITIVICRGTIISTVCILFVLPSLLLLFDKIIEKTTKNIKFIK